MNSQNKNEWLKPDNHDYYDRQFNEPYRSTIKFCDWLENIGCFQLKSPMQSILDIGTGKGSNIYYMSKRFPSCRYLGLDINVDFVREGNDFFHKKNLKNCKLEFGDLYNPDFFQYRNRFDGIVSYQTLSWLPEGYEALENIINLNPKWIALTSLFYEGLIDCKIEVNQYHNPENLKSSFYNVYSIPRIKNLLEKKGYKRFKYHKFFIDIDLPKPSHNRMQTYTEKLSDERRLQISGPLLMNWYFIYAEKT